MLSIIFVARIRLIFFTLAGLSLLNELSAQSSEITEIRKQYYETRQRKSSYTQLTQDVFKNSSEGGRSTAYKDEDEIKMIETVYYGHLGKTESQYYFSSNRLSFVFVINYQYNVPPTEPDYDETKTVVEELRYYFLENEMIRFLDADGALVNKNSLEFKEHEGRIVDWAKEELLRWE